MYVIQYVSSPVQPCIRPSFLCEFTSLPSRNGPFELIRLRFPMSVRHARLIRFIHSVIHGVILIMNLLLSSQIAVFLRHTRLKRLIHSVIHGVISIMNLFLSSQIAVFLRHSRLTRLLHGPSRIGRF